MLIGFWADEEYVRKLDAARGSVPRSEFVRRKLAEFLRSQGVDIPDEVAGAPDRTGKGRSRATSAVQTPAPRQARAWPRPGPGGTVILADDTADGHPEFPGADLEAQVAALNEEGAVSFERIAEAIGDAVGAIQGTAASAPALPAPRPARTARRGGRTGRGVSGGSGESTGGGVVGG